MSSGDRSMERSPPPKRRKVPPPYPRGHKRVSRPLLFTPCETKKNSLIDKLDKLEVKRTQNGVSYGVRRSRRDRRRRRDRDRSRSRYRSRSTSQHSTPKPSKDSDRSSRHSTPKPSSEADKSPQSDKTAPFKERKIGFNWRPHGIVKKHKLQTLHKGPKYTFYGPAANKWKPLTGRGLHRDVTKHRKRNPKRGFPFANKGQRKKRHFNSTKKLEKDLQKCYFSFQGHKFRSHWTIRVINKFFHFEPENGEMVAKLTQEAVDEEKQRFLRTPQPLKGKRFRGEQGSLTGFFHRTTKGTDVLVTSDIFESVGQQNNAGNDLNLIQAKYVLLKLNAIRNLKVRAALQKALAPYLALQNSYRQVLALNNALKASSYKTYESRLTPFLKKMMEIRPETFSKVLVPFLIINKIREGEITRTHFEEYFTCAMMQQVIGYRTAAVSFAAFQYFFEAATGEPLLNGSKEAKSLQRVYTALRKTYKQKAKGCCVLTEIECNTLFDTLEEVATTPQELLWAVAAPFAKKFLLRISEQLELRQKDIIFHKSVKNFTEKDRITVVIEANKSNVGEIQSVTYDFNKDQTEKYSVFWMIERINSLRQNGSDSNRTFFLKKNTSESAFRKFFKKGVDTFKQKYPAYKGKSITFHTWRSSQISLLFASGVDINIIAMLARHSSPTTTFQSYVSKNDFLT